MVENIIAAVIVFVSLGFVLFILVKAAGDRKSMGCGLGCACSMSCAQPACPEHEDLAEDEKTPGGSS